MTEKEFYNLYDDHYIWNVGCPYCDKVIEGKPHYRDAEDENDYVVCPHCGNKLYVSE